MRRAAGWGLLAVLALLCAPRGTRAADLTTLVDSVVATYGGPRAAARMGSHRVEGEVTAKYRGVTAEVRRDFQAPDRLRVEISCPDRTEVRILDGPRGWRGDARRLERVEGALRVAMVHQLLRSALPWSLVRHRSRLVDRGAARRGGVDCRLVGLPWSRELDLTYWVDATSRRILWVEGRVGPPGRIRTLATAYGDFRRVEGVLIPFREENHAVGRHTGTTRIRTVTFAPTDLGPFSPGSAGGG